MACQSIGWWGAAPASGVAVICIASLVGSSRSLVLRDQREVGALSRGVMLHPCSTPIRAITAQRSLFPASCTRCPIGASCDYLPLREGIGLTGFGVCD